MPVSFSSNGQSGVVKGELFLRVLPGRFWKAEEYEEYEECRWKLLKQRAEIIALEHIGEKNGSSVLISSPQNPQKRSGQSLDSHLDVLGQNVPGFTNSR